ncbi:helix-turn-helix transcriptional regulator [Sporosarcina sp. P17b]|uniref:helix-turn-helix transcriptional regulator n=1 Tax=Sporosarcina sp. P17b TaxID=2048260 RepID=UPI000C172B72|nr:helix-turn-helix transcriptional regulator [Sporosarcina sp. P17b]PIC72396.1 transcriptional regulator [Sporosarcina sp. P17b]
MVEKEKLKVLRVKADLSQEELARKAGMTSRSIGLYEADVNNLRKARYETVATLAEALGVTVNDIFLG